MIGRSVEAPIAPVVPRRRRLLRESPLILGLLLGWVLLLRWGHAFVITPVPVGPDWNQYFMAAWKVIHRLPEDYPEFRYPLYPWLVGTLGARLGYVAAAVILSSLGATLIVLAAGLGARALAGPWAGGLAAAAVPWVETTLQSARWSSQYAVLGAAGGLAVAMGAWAARRPRPWIFLATGLAAGLVWAVDARGVPFAVTVALLSAVGLTRRISWKGRCAALLAWAAGFLVGPVSQARLEVIPRRPSAYLVAVQRRMAMEDIRAFRTPGIYEACRGRRYEAIPLLDMPFTSCGKALLRHNLGLYGRELPFGLILTLVALPAALLPGRGGWRATVASGLYFLPPVFILAVVGVILDVPARYLVPYASILAGVVPVGAVRLVRTWAPETTRWRRPLEAVAVCLAGTWLLFAGPPAAARSPRRNPYTQQQQVMGRLMHAVKTRVSDRDRVLDCSHNLRIEVALMPRVHEPDPAKVRESPDIRRCRRWVYHPPQGEGDRWLITGKDHFLAPGTTGRWKLEVAVRLPEAEGYLWHWTGSGAR